jgi:hypothetical protein
MTVISYPIPAYQNLPITPQFYSPNFCYISNITLGPTTTVTTKTNVEFVIGSLCRLIIPNGWGCRQLNEITGYVISVPMPNQVVLNIFSTGGDPFTSSTNTTLPTLCPVGDINTGQINTSDNPQGLFIPGSYINIS